jgi:hypothetical protein
VFVQNAYTSPTAVFNPLANGGYITTDSASSVFGLFDAANANVGWISLPADAPTAPQIDALNGGGFVFTYAGTSHFDLFDATGALQASGDLGATGSSFATGFASLPGAGDGFIESWLSPDGGQNGLATALDVQLTGPRGAITPVLTVAQDLDPWHTQFQLQAHADGSAAILWSQGGAVFGSEYANGSAGPAYGALAGALSTTVVIPLANDQTGFAYLQNGDLLAEIFNPATGAVARSDLGAASGGLSTIHALATANGGMAVSWHTALGVDGAVVGASGLAGAPVALPGDLIGVNGSGQAITLHDQNGTPVLQAYAVNDTLFWVA